MYYGKTRLHEFTQNLRPERKKYCLVHHIPETIYSFYLLFELLSFEVQEKWSVSSTFTPNRTRRNVFRFPYDCTAVFPSNLADPLSQLPFCFWSTDLLSCGWWKYVVVDISCLVAVRSEYHLWCFFFCQGYCKSSQWYQLDLKDKRPQVNVDWIGVVSNGNCLPEPQRMK